MAFPCRRGDSYVARTFLSVQSASGTQDQSREALVSASPEPVLEGTIHFGRTGMSGLLSSSCLLFWVKKNRKELALHLVPLGNRRNTLQQLDVCIGTDSVSEGIDDDSPSWPLG